MKAGGFAPPATSLPGSAADRVPRVGGSLVLLRVFHVKNGTFFALFSGSLYWEWIFSGSLYWDWIFRAPNRSRAARTAGALPEDLKKQLICPFNRTTDADPVIGPNIKKGWYLPI